MIFSCLVLSLPGDSKQMWHSNVTLLPAIFWAPLPLGICSIAVNVQHQLQNSRYQKINVSTQICVMPRLESVLDRL